MQINNWFDLIIFTLFTFAVMVIGFPISLYLLKKGIEGFGEYKFKKLPKAYLIAPGLGTYSFEVAFYGILIFAFTIWYLFIDKGGQLQNLITNAKTFLVS